MSLWDDCIWWYVNLDHRVDRRLHVELQFAKHGIKANRYPGLHTTRENYVPQENLQRMFNRTPGACGCYLSQRDVIRKAIDSERPVIVCEDDIVLCDDLRERFDYLDEHVPTDWDIIWLGATFHREKTWDTAGLGCDAKRVGHRIFRTYAIWSTYCYVINQKSAAKILDLMDLHVSESNGIDHLMMLNIEPVMNTYCMAPGCAWQLDNASDIGNGPNAWTQFSHFIETCGAHAWQKNMNDFDPDGGYDWKDAG